MSVDLSPLWEPLHLGPITVRNRVMAGPTTLLYAEDNVLSDRHVAFFAERAKGGAGLLVTEEHGAFRLGIGAFPDACSAWHERAVPRFAQLAEAVHAHGAHQLVQLYAPGVNDGGTLIIDQWHPLWAPSRVPAPGGDHPLAIDGEQIAELVDGFATSAANVARGGLDGVELHAAHGWLLGQFLSPHFNRRTDGYGGSVANRCRLLLEIAEAVRARVGDGQVLGVQLSVDEHLGEHGITPEQTDEQLELIAASGLFDYVNVSTGSQFSTHWTIATMEVPESYLAEHGARAKRIVGERMKVVLVGRIRTLPEAARLVAAGAADVVAMTRAQFADPQLVRKGREDRLDEIVPCIGENDCIVRALGARLPVTCLMNPAMGREREWGSTPTTASRRSVVVVGGGPAGLKAAAVAARRGHDVTLLERRALLGGHLEPLSRLPGRAAWAEAIDAWTRDALRAGVEIRTETDADVDALVAAVPDVVLCATGATWDRSGASSARPGHAPIPGMEGPRVLDVAAATVLALADPRQLGARVVIVDESGEYLPLGLADLLSAAGVSVDVVSLHAVVGQQVRDALEAPHVLGRLAARDVRLVPGHLLEALDDDRVELRELWSGRRRAIERVDRVVLSMLRSPEASVYERLGAALPDVRRIGDALAPRRTHEVVYEAEAVARSL